MNAPEADQTASQARLLMNVGKTRRAALCREIEANGYTLPITVKTPGITAWIDIMTGEMRLVEDPPTP